MLKNRVSASVVTAAMAWGVVGALAQTPDRPGPMQSGAHASQAASASASAAAASAAASSSSSSATTPPTASASSPAPFDPKQLFTNVCGWCHSSGGRTAGKGPQLMGTTLTDGEIAYRIKVGKVGQMPSFASALTEPQIAAVIVYIRNLKPE